MFDAIGSPEHDRVLWYRSPAADWDGALPVGSGRLGAMLFGRPGEERVQLNEEHLWAGGHVDRTNPDAGEHLEEVRSLLLEGRHGRAEEIAERHLLGDPPRIRPYQTLGDLHVEMDHGPVLDSAPPAPEEYRRWLDVRSGVAGVEYQAGDRAVRRECLASAEDDLIAFRVEPATGTVSLTVTVDRPRDARSATDGDRLRLRGGVLDFPDAEAGPGGWGVAFEAQVRVRAPGGTVTAVDDASALRVEDADAVTVLLTAATDAEGVDPATRCDGLLDRVAGRSYATIRERHVTDHRERMERVAVDFGPAREAPTDRRLGAIADGDRLADDPDLAALLFEYGRYLLLASSRPGGLPANLQGIWNEECEPPWGSDFHLNVNLQMNYWPAEACNLPECVEPLIDFAEGLRGPGREVAREHYGCAGMVAHHVSDPWGTATPADGVQGIWPMGAVWCCAHLYDRFRYGRDERFLRERAYPLMRESARFLLEYLVEDDGELVTVPAHSPENSFLAPDGTEAGLCVAPTMDVVLARELFENCIDAAERLGVDPDLRAELGDAVDRLPDLQVGAHGQLQEWREDHEELDPGHRHISHLYGFHPGECITLRGTPDLADAVRTSLDRRLEHGGANTGWSRAWMVSQFARLEDGAAVGDHLTELLRAYTQPNLLGVHPPGLFQIDATFGATAGIAEALLGSHAGELRLLPALPEAFAEGSVSGLRARGGFEVDLSWSAGTLDRATVRSAAGERCRLRTRDVELSFEDAPEGLEHDGPDVVAFDTEPGRAVEVVATDR